VNAGAVERVLGLGPDRRASGLLRLPEDQWFDRKSARVGARELADTLLAFANAEGGTVVVGLWNGVVEGIDAAGPAMLARWQQAAIDFTSPPVPQKAQLVECRNRRGERDRLLVVQVEVAEQVHTNRKDEVYLRVGDENRRLTYLQRRELLYDKRIVSNRAVETAGAASFATSYGEDAYLLLHSSRRTDGIVQESR